MTTPDNPFLSANDGILSLPQLEEAFAKGILHASAPLIAGQIQPASLDLRLGAKAWRVQASFLPGAGNKVTDKLADLAMHEIDLSAGAVLEKGCVYIAEIMESLHLPAGVTALANPKSSTGRLDVFTRLIVDAADEF
ncbi:MAG: 2'-deoxycytidine 5'-triphosphate deaminase, partial [Alphaproteobacteria bacterium]|nr:2'-deoxycytidine 5'-triphosphate deaminase [Alphaproteobacteria bacterium]